MNSRKWTWILTLVVALGMALAGAGSAAASPGVDQLPQTKIPNSGKFSMSGSLSSQGQSIPINGSGAFSGQDAMLDISLRAPEGVTSGPDQIGVNLVALDNKIYFKTSGLSSLGAGADDKWYVSDLGTAGVDGMPGSIVGMPGSLTDIEGMLDAAVSSKRIGKEAINGAATTKYQIDVDLEKVASATGGTSEDIGDSKLTMFLWLGDTDMYVHQFNMMLTVDNSSGDIGLSLDLDLTVTFFRLRYAYDYHCPPNAEPVDLGLNPSILAGMPGSTSNPIMGMGSDAGMPRTGSGSDNNMLLLSLLALSMGLVLSGVATRKLAGAKRNA